MFVFSPLVIIEFVWFRDFWCCLPRYLVVYRDILSSSIKCACFEGFPVTLVAHRDACSDVWSQFLLSTFACTDVKTLSTRNAVRPFVMFGIEIFKT